MEMPVNEGHTQHHQWYLEQTQKNGASCCNNRDCRPAEDFELVPGGARVKIRTGWIMVPENKLQYKTPDGQAHYCGTRGQNGSDLVFCVFIPSLV